MDGFVASKYWKFPNHTPSSKRLPSYNYRDGNICHAVVINCDAYIAPYVAEKHSVVKIANHQSPKEMGDHLKLKQIDFVIDIISTNQKKDCLLFFFSCLALYLYIIRYYYNLRIIITITLPR
jgi:hypothetical protein